MVLAITDTGQPTFESYVRWVRQHSPEIQLVRLSRGQRNADALSECQGLVLTGGGDVHPKWYGGSDTAVELEGVSAERDEFDLQVIGQVLHLQRPILGICRGMQLFNVARGGSLHQDLEKAGYQNHRKIGPGVDRIHEIRVTSDTLARAVVGRDLGIVNSSHHQAVATLGEGLRASAVSPDGVIEAAEWLDRAQVPFVLLVQWHPERMKDGESPFSRGIIERFLAAVKSVRTTY